MCACVCVSICACVHAVCACVHMYVFVYVHMQEKIKREGFAVTPIQTWFCRAYHFDDQSYL